MKSVVVAAALTALSGAGAAAHQDVGFPRGELIERIVTAVDSNQSYALYLPTGYEPVDPLPLVLLMDPRGRALIPLRRMVEPAERLGYIVVSSYNTMSDGPITPNEEAIDALLKDVPSRFSIDARRIYLVGFSGTARAAWDFAYRLRDYVAGMVGFGGGLPERFPLNAIVLAEGIPFVFFGGAGTTGFNYEEMRALEAQLARLGFRSRFRFFNGAHQWPPAEIFAQALEWLELEAVRVGLTSRSAAWIDSVHARHVDAARSLEAAGRLYDASRSYAAIAGDFEGLHETGDVAERAAELAERPAVRHVIEQMDRIADREAQYQRRLFSLLGDLRTTTDLPSPADLVGRLQIHELQRTVETADDSLEMTAAQRLLEIVFVRMSFYEPRSYLENEAFDKARLVLQVAQEIRPRAPRVCYGLAQALAQLGDESEALHMLECLVDSGTANADVILEDSYLAPLRSRPEFQAIVERLRQGRGSPTPR
jgi:predicted esterase